MKVENGDKCILRLLGLAILPLRNDISGLANTVDHLATRVSFLESAEKSGNMGAANPANWGAPHDLNIESYNLHIPIDPTHWADCAAPEDNAEMAGYDDKYKRKCNKPNNWFFHLFTLENGLVSGSPLSPGQLSEVVILQDMWYDFCHDFHSNTSIPLPETLSHAFWQYCQNLCAAQATTICIAQNNLVYSNGREPTPIPVLPSARPTPAPMAPPSCIPISDHTWDRARPSVAQKDCPTFATLGDDVHDPIMVSLDGDTPTPTTVPWMVIGRKNGHSYAGVAVKAAPPRPSLPPPTIYQAQAGSIMAKQLHAITKNQVVNVFNLCFSPCITTSRHSKDGIIVAYLDQASRPVTEAKQPPALKPIWKMEYTLIRDPQASLIAGLSGCRGNAADLVHTI